VHLPGEAARVPVAVLREWAQAAGALAPPFLGYLGAFLTLATQTAACNRLHALEQRCCRWLLMTHDRARADQFPLTQGFFAQLLGVRRASIAGVARSLQEAGLIRSTRGKVTILDRPGLEAASCECYPIIRQAFDHVHE
jgi:CRP-like cAMP-binding protein